MLRVSNPISLAIACILVGVSVGCSAQPDHGVDTAASLSTSRSSADWSITDLCEQADLVALQALLPVWGPTRSTTHHSDELADSFECLIAAGETEELVGALNLRALVGEDVSGHFGDFSSPSHAVAHLGAQAAIAVDAASGSVQLDVLDGALRFHMTWLLPAHDIPDGLDDAMIEAARATIVRLRTS